MNFDMKKIYRNKHTETTWTSFSPVSVMFTHTNTPATHREEIHLETDTNSLIGLAMEIENWPHFRLLFTVLSVSDLSWFQHRLPGFCFRFRHFIWWKTLYPSVDHQAPIQMLYFHFGLISFSLFSSSILNFNVLLLETSCLFMLLLFFFSSISSPAESLWCCPCYSQIDCRAAHQYPNWSFHFL